MAMMIDSLTLHPSHILTEMEMLFNQCLSNPHSLKGRATHFPNFKNEFIPK
jgi:hypothetical protein